MSCCTPQNEVPTKADGSFAITGELICLIIAGFIAGNSTLVALVANLSAGENDASVRFWMQTGLLVATAIVAMLLAPQLWRSLIANIRRRKLSVDVLFLLGCIGALGFSMWSYWTGVGAVYFEVVSILLFIYCLGSWIKGTSQGNVLKGLDAWSPERHRCHRLDENGMLSSVFVKEIVAGNLVQVPAGAMIPVDGTVARGGAFLRTSTMTGEPHVQAVTAGDSVFASSILVDSPLLIRAAAPGDQRVIDQLTRSVDEAAKRPSRWETLADRVAKWFMPLVATASLTTFLVWWLLASFEVAIMNALAVLLVACPCAFGFATPVAIWSTLSRLSEQSMLVRRNDVIERLAEIDTVVFDKTGTLTRVEPTLIQLHRRHGTPWQQDDLLLLIRSLEAGSQHPIAQAFHNADDVTIPLDDFQWLPGIGVAGSFATDVWSQLSFSDQNDGPLKLTFGRLTPLRQKSGSNLVTLNDPWQSLIARSNQSGNQLLAVEIQGRIEAVAEIGELPIDTLESGLERLQQLGITTKIFSGDSANRVQRLGVSDVQSDMSPEEKLASCQQLLESGKKVLFVGDGTNDAGAMSVASASIAIESGSSLAAEAADILWQSSDLQHVGNAIEICRKTTSQLKTTLLLAITYNTVGMTVAAAGLIHPVVAVVLMLASSLTVVLRATR
ncbi:MAG: cation-translocating P-type ATPase [Planctomycetota bacterium]